MGQVWDDKTYDFTIWNNRHNNLFNFDTKTECDSLPDGDNDECCGSYPNRRPFNSFRAECCPATGDLVPFGAC